MTRRVVRLLLVDPSADDARAVCDALREAGVDAHVRRVDDAAAMRTALQASPADAVLCAQDTPGLDGLEALETFRALALDLPFVFLSRADDVPGAVAAMRAGASDVVVRQRLARLVPTLEREVLQAALRARHREAQRELEHTRDAYVDLYEFAPVGYLTLTEAGGIVQVNQTGAELLGAARADLAGTAFERFVLPADLERWRLHLRRAAEGGDRQRAELRLCAAHGALIHVQVDSRRVLEEGAPPRVRVSLADVSEHKEAESSLRRFETRLREVQKLESLGTLAGGIAHDFNNVLAAILGNVELARDDLAGDHRARARLDEIRRASLRARDLIHQILMFSRQEPQVLVTQPLAPVMEETRRLLDATLPARVDLAFDLAPEPLYIHADATQVQQVMMNLCTNAWHALQGGAGHVRVKVARAGLGAAEARRLGLDAAGDFAHVQVSDDGIGIEPQTLPRIFEPFFTTKAAGQGTGLGLSVVQGIVASHHGAIDVDSAPGRGSTFHLWFPCAEAPAAAGAASDAAVLPRPGAGQRVVYIDDDETMAVMVQRLLERAGFRVSCFTDAARALDVLRLGTEPVDCVVTDFNMPEISGLELARALQAARPGLPVIVSSGFLSDELRREAREAGVRALMQKQDTVHELADLVGLVMAGSVTR
jgi:PAS domain S-box-containing protein